MREFIALYTHTNISENQFCDISQVFSETVTNELSMWLYCMIIICVTVKHIHTWTCWGIYSSKKIEHHAVISHNVHI